MAKIQEITELLVNEIESFDKSVSELKKQVAILQFVKLTPKTEELDLVFNTHFSSLKNIQNSFLNQLKSDKAAERGQHISKVQLLIILFLFIVSFGSLVYSNFTLQQIDKKEKIAYTEGAIDIKKHIKSFFKDNPQAENAYNKWNKK